MGNKRNSLPESGFQNLVISIFLASVISTIAILSFIMDEMPSDKKDKDKKKESEE